MAYLLNNVKLLGTELESIQQAEDREMFRTLMNDLNVPVPESDIVNTVEQAFEFKEQVGYPLIVRPAFTMGGTGGGICYNDDDLKEVVSNGLHYSPATQCLIEKSIAGYKEIEYEVMRDKMIMPLLFVTWKISIQLVYIQGFHCRSSKSNVVRC